MLPEGHIIQQATSLEEMNSVTDKGTIFVTKYYLTYGSARWFKLERLPTAFCAELLSRPTWFNLVME